jgi:hypothetical protein
MTTAGRKWSRRRTHPTPSDRKRNRVPGLDRSGGRLAHRLKALAARRLPPAAKRQLLSALDLGYTAFGYTRALAGSPGSLPDFLIIGAQRCGTTYLYDLLTDHPSVRSASHKEIHFFDRHFARGLQWYQGHFPVNGSGSSQFELCGEATPTYIAYRSVRDRVHELLPDVRLIVLVRNPVDRALSHYHHFVRLGYESRPFEDAIASEYDYLTAGHQPLLADSPHRTGDPLYLSHGIYVDQLRLWLERFRANQLLVLRSEHFFENPTQALDDLAGFLEIPNEFTVGRHTPKQFGYVAANVVTRERLAKLFAPFNHDLESLLDVRLRWDA